MAILKCKMCGGSLEPTDTSVVVCEYCGTKQTIPILDDEKMLRLFDRANSYRTNCEFDKASLFYEEILSEHPDNSEANWGICLCKYGIEYVDDRLKGRRVPTCHRTQFKSILDDSNYLAAINNCDHLAKEIYCNEAKYIDTVQRNILAISAKEEPFDIFICYKETDQDGNRTKDSVIAQEIYTDLTEMGYKVFFSRITLEDKLGIAYEPYIFSALNSAPLMLVVGTNPDYFDAVWVKNEWGRYLRLIEQGQKKTLVPCYRDMSISDMPAEFAILQSQDVSKVGWKQDLLRGIGKILPRNTEPKITDNHDQKTNSSSTQPNHSNAQPNYSYTAPSNSYQRPNRTYVKAATPPIKPPITNPYNNKSKKILKLVIYSILGAFIGCGGVHSFYADKPKKGWLQLGVFVVLSYLQASRIAHAIPLSVFWGWIDVIIALKNREIPTPKNKKFPFL